MRYLIWLLLLGSALGQVVVPGSSGSATTPANLTTKVHPTTCSGTDKVSAIDSSGNVTCNADKTGGAGSTEIQANGVDTTDQTVINFQSGTNLTVSNPSAGNVQFAVSGLATVATSGVYADLSGLPQLPVNTTATVHQFFSAYDSATGAFTKAQPACGDLSDSAGGCSMSTTAGGDLIGTLPSPTVAKVNGTSIPTNAAADQVILTTASATGSWASVPSCSNATTSKLLYNTATHAFSCGSDQTGAPGGGYATVDEEGTALTQQTTLNFIGAAITAADDAVNSRTNVTLSISPSSASVVGTGRTLTGGAGIAAIGDLSADRTIATASGEADFLASGALTCGAGTQGKAQVHTTPLQYCDNNATPTLRYAAYADSTGKATSAASADSATTAFANQGTTTTVLHGNAAGNPSFGAVSLTADVTGTLAAGNGGTGNAFFAVSGPATTTKTFTFPNASATVLTSNAAVTPAQGGTGASNTATSGQILRGNGTNFVSADDIRSLTYLAGSDTASAALADTDDQPTFWRNNLGRTYRITEVWCESDAGTPTINLQRDDGTPANVLSADLTCSTSGATGTIAALEQDMASTNKLDFVMVAAGGTAKRVTVNIQLTAQ